MGDRDRPICIGIIHFILRGIERKTGFESPRKKLEEFDNIAKDF
jgi:hypothetical protein